jgi:iron complex outermembrane receptor protein
VNPFINSIGISCSCALLVLRQLFVVFPVWEYQQTNARLAGVDVQTHWKMSEQWQHDFALAYVNGRDITNKESLIDIRH